ncbi:MAG TPA: hypothetical protein PLV42_03125 [bacterium]|nr:hypothetical protein [bacterium]
MKRTALFFAVLLLLPVMIAEAADEDSLLTDEDIIVESGVNFDIPPEATDWPSGREKHYCSCAPEASAVCLEQEYAYLIKVQNWGDAVAHEVMVSDSLSPYLDYIPHSTEMATEFDENGVGLDWTAIPDKPAETFPLSDSGYLVADTMAPCDRDTLSCTDTRLIRFKVKPKPGLPKPVVIENRAMILHSAGWEYTNANIPLKLRGGSCLPASLCAETKPECIGLIKDVDTTSDDDALMTDHIIPDTTTTPDTDKVKPKDDGCGCSVVF